MSIAFDDLPICRALSAFVEQDPSLSHNWIKQVIDADKEGLWKNDICNGNSVLVFALTQKNWGAVNILFAEGYEASYADLEYALWSEAAIENLDWRNRELMTPSLGKYIQNLLLYVFSQLKLAEAIGMPPDEMLLQNLIDVLPFFISRVELSFLLATLIQEAKIGDFEMKILTPYYHQLFLKGSQQQPADFEEMIKNLTWIQHFNPLIKLLIYKSCQDISRRRSLHLEPLKQKKLHPIAVAILETDRRYFANLKIENMIPALQQNTQSQAWYEPDQNAAANDPSWIEKLTKFIQFSILWRESRIQENYRFWFRIMESLLKEGDLYGGFFVGSALSSMVIERDFRSSTRIPFVDPADNFAEYKKLEQKKWQLLTERGEDSPPQLLLPCLVPINKELMAIPEKTLFYCQDGQILLNKNNINFLLNFKEKLEWVITQAQNYKYETSGDVEEFFIDLPDISEELIFACSQANYINYESKRTLEQKKVNEWKFDDISLFLAKSAIDRKYHKDILHALIENFGVLNGSDLLEALACQWDTVYLGQVDPNDRNSIIVSQKRPILDFFELARSHAKRENSTASIENCVQTNTSKERFLEMEAIYSRFAKIMGAETKTRTLASPRVAHNTYKEGKDGQPELRAYRENSDERRRLSAGSEKSALSSKHWAKRRNSRSLNDLGAFFTSLPSPKKTSKKRCSIATETDPIKKSQSSVNHESTTHRKTKKRKALAYTQPPSQNLQKKHELVPLLPLAQVPPYEESLNDGENKRQSKKTKKLKVHPGIRRKSVSHIDIKRSGKDKK